MSVRKKENVAVIIFRRKLFDRYVMYNKGRQQGDQIGRISALWAIVSFGHFFENYKSVPHFCDAF
jgi:hypothetical protein